jgi:hypothetical protein
MKAGVKGLLIQSNTAKSEISKVIKGKPQHYS